METTLTTAQILKAVNLRAKKALKDQKSHTFNFLIAESIAVNVAQDLTNEKTCFAFWLLNEQKAGREISIEEGKMYRRILQEAQAQVRKKALQAILDQGLVPNCKLAQNFINA
jgi:hypothetical protein